MNGNREEMDCGVDRGKNILVSVMLKGEPDDAVMLYLILS